MPQDERDRRSSWGRRAADIELPHRLDRLEAKVDKLHADHGHVVERLAVLETRQESGGLRLESVDGKVDRVLDLLKAQAAIAGAEQKNQRDFMVWIQTMVGKFAPYSLPFLLSLAGGTSAAYYLGQPKIAQHAPPPADVAP
jgi:hypothetical protein